MACLDSCCSLIVFSSSSCDGSGGVAHILCFAFVTFPSRPLDNRSFTVVRDILSVKVRMCVCLWWNQSFYLFLFAYFSNEYELMWLRSLGVKFGLKQRGNTVSCGGFMKVSEMWEMDGNFEDEKMTKCTWVVAWFGVFVWVFRQFSVLGFAASKDGSVSFVFFFYISKFISSFFSLLLSRFNISVFFGTW